MEVAAFKATLVATLPNVDFLFGNANEARTFAKTEGWPTGDVAEIAARVGLPAHPAPGVLALALGSAPLLMC